MTDAEAATSADLIVVARLILDGTIPMPRGRAPRAAAVVARQALESAVSARCRALVGNTDRPTTRSELIVLRELGGDPAIGRAAHSAWDHLSRACHLHAYELAPSTSEVAAAVSLVEQVVDGLAGPAATG